MCTLSIIIIDKDKPSDVKQTDDVFSDAHNHDWLSCTEGVGATGAVHINNKRRKSSMTNSKKLQISGNTVYLVDLLESQRLFKIHYWCHFNLATHHVRQKSIVILIHTDGGTQVILYGQTACFQGIIAIHVTACYHTTLTHEV